MLSPKRWTPPQRWVAYALLWSVLPIAVWAKSGNLMLTLVSLVLAVDIPARFVGMAPETQSWHPATWGGQLLKRYFNLWWWWKEDRGGVQILQWTLRALVVLVVLLYVSMFLWA